MFKKLAQFRALGSSHAVSVPRRLIHSNDNRPCTRPPGALRRNQRPILACRWQPVMGGGRLECRWSIELVESSTADEPQPRWTIGPSDHSMNNLKEVDNAHHPRGQLRPRSRAPLVRPWPFSAREFYPASCHQSLRTAHDPSGCSSCGAIRREMFGAISGAADVRTQAAS